MRSSDDADGDLALQVRELLGSLGAPALAPFLADWPERTARQTRRGSGAEAAPGRASAALPVLRCIRDVEDAADIFGPAVTRTFCRQAPALHWRQTYGAGEAAAGFLRNYGYTELLGPDAPWPAISISCGFLLLGPSTRYPPHRHLAEEIYLPLCGTAHWQQGARGWEALPPGTLIHHESGVPHAMQTGSQPLLALYVWRGGHLDQKARMERENVR